MERSRNRKKNSFFVWWRKKIKKKNGIDSRGRIKDALVVWHHPWHRTAPLVALWWRRRRCSLTSDISRVAFGRTSGIKYITSSNTVERLYAHASHNNPPLFLLSFLSCQSTPSFSSSSLPRCGGFFFCYLILFFFLSFLIIPLLMPIPHS